MTSDGTKIYLYNALNQLTQVKRASDNAVIATYTYNHNGLRRSKTVNGVTTTYNWDASGNLTRETTAGASTYFYYVGGDLVGLKKNNTTYIVHDNLRGDVEVITDTAGNIVAQAQYDPWGNCISSSGTLIQPMRYAGYYYDDETGLYYLKSRYYSPVLGRFLTKDDIEYIKDSEPQTLNLYSYCGNNPINYNDPTGFSPSADSIIGYCGEQYNLAKKRKDSEGMAYWHQVADYYRGKGPNPDELREVSLSDDPVFLALSMLDGYGEGRVVGGKILGYTKHGLAQAIGRDGVGVSVDAILNAVKNPSKIIEQAGGKLKYIGENATVVVNKYGQIITTWASNHLGWRK